LKLVRYGPHGAEKPGIIDAGGTLRDLSGQLDDITPERLGAASLEKLRALDAGTLPRVEGKPRLGIPVAGIRQCVAIGLNYRRHAQESGMAIPTEPVVFFKAITSLSGPTDDIEVPRGSEATDWEIELAIVIGTTAKRVDRDRALDYVAGYAIANDVSEREWQLNRNGQWSKGKSFDTFCPLGPWLVTRDEIPNPQALALELSVNGEVKQRSSTSDMIFGVAEVVSYCSSFMTLLPGDVIITGTPEGVGWAAKPRRMLREGDVLRLTIEGLGEQVSHVVWGPPSERR
jgi:2-keto-4-pentenoate hydratase/2-oxohepta-3-ene-1,7-dioic acid hydratase in catechol pathway